MPSSIWGQARSLPDSQQGQAAQQPVAAQAPQQNSQPTIWDRARGLSFQNGKAPGLMDDVRDSANFLKNEVLGLLDPHNISNAIGGIGSMLSMGLGMNPQGLKDAVQHTSGQLQQASDSPDAAGVIMHGAGAIPGSPTGDMYEQYKSGQMDDLAKNIGHTAFQAVAPKALATIAPALAAKAAPLVDKTSGVISNFTKVDPAIAAIRAWSPTPTEYGFEQRLPETLAKIQDAYGQPVKTNVQAIEATQKAMDNHKQAYQAWLGRGRATGATAPGDAIVEATRKAIPETMWQEDPDMAQAIVDKTQRAYGGKNLTTDQLETFRKEKTADLKSFYDKNTGNQIASVVGGSPEAVIKAQRDTIADSLYKALDPQGQGATPRQIQLDRSDMIDVKNAAMRRSNVAIGSKPVSKASAVISAVPKAIQSMVSHPGIGYVKAADISNPATLFAGAVDPWVAKAFGAVYKTKVTRPVMPPLLPMPAQNP